MVNPFQIHFFTIFRKFHHQIKDLVDQKKYLFRKGLLKSVEYRKYYYWVSKADYEENLQKISEIHPELKMKYAESRQCEALYAAIPFMIVKPEVWSANCYRQGSWFRTSEFREKYLFVSNTPLNCIKFEESGEIRIIKLLDLPEFQLNEEFMKKVEFFINHPQLKARAPEEWFHILDRERPLFENFIRNRKLGVDLPTFLKIHTANHASFIIQDDKRLVNYVKLDGEKSEIICSICPEEFVCSGCLEIFGILGQDHPKLLIKRCPGLKYVKMDKNEYFYVQKYR